MISILPLNSMRKVCIVSSDRGLTQPGLPFLRQSSLTGTRSQVTS